MISTWAAARWPATAEQSSSVEFTRMSVAPIGGVREVGPLIRTTSAPRANAASASAYPMRPLERLVSTRTGSSGSRVGPAVTTTFFPFKGLRVRPSSRST